MKTHTQTNVRGKEHEVGGGMKSQKIQRGLEEGMIHGWLV